MKKRLLALSLCIGMIATAMVGCGDKDKGTETETKAKEKTTLKWTIERADYVGLEVEESKAVLSDEDLEKYIESDLKANSERLELTSVPAEEGMIVNVKYTGTVDGEEVISKEAEVELVEDGFAFEGFVDGIIGKLPGETVELALKYPDDYADESLRGTDITFNVEIKNVYKEIIPELNDEYVKKVYDYLGISTVDEYKAEYRRSIELQMVYNAVWPMITENVEVESYDSEEVDSMVTEYLEEYELYLTQNGVTLDYVLEYNSMSKDDLIAEYEESVKDEIKYYLIRDYIAETEGITVTDEEYNEEMQKTLVAYDVETEEELYKFFEEQGYSYSEEYFKDNFLTNKVVEFLYDNIVIVPDAEEEETEEGETESE